ncbi:MAG: MarR family transcriptional regulator [Candidatus Thalassarchaeaceae archaeon]|nr:MarR family transcriptional regulator [Candidatus Thalassarchaeaceae archaeon]
MDGTPGEGQEPPMDRVARITLALGGFMLILLIAVPFTFESATSGYFASYVIYSLFLTSVGVIIGVSLMWLNDPRRQPSPGRDAPSTPRMLSADQQTVVGILSSRKGSMWQAELVRETGFTDSKASRLLSRMEAEGHIRRIRDGMGKRVELAEEGN